MSTKKTEKKEVIATTNLSKKELYDLNKKKKEESTKKKEKTEKKKKKQQKTYSHNLGARIFAIIMLILMIGSVMASIFAYLQ